MDDEKRKKYEEAFYKFRKEAYKKHPLKSLFLEVTLRCNARCEHCGSSCGDKIQKDEVTKEELEKVLEDIVSAGLYPPQQVMLNITGGEPLVRKDLFEILAYADNLGFPWGITTNGILIDEKVVKKMVETHMYSVSVSIDGLKETHEKFRKVPGSYEKILKGIELMQKEPSIKVVQVTTCVNKKNIDELDALYEQFLNMGVKYWRIIEVDPIGRALENNDMLLDGEGFKRIGKVVVTLLAVYVVLELAAIFPRIAGIDSFILGAEPTGVNAAQLFGSGVLTSIFTVDFSYLATFLGSVFATYADVKIAALGEFVLCDKFCASSSTTTNGLSLLPTFFV